MTRPIIRNGVRTRVYASPGVEATKNATSAVIASPAHIQP